LATKIISNNNNNNAFSWYLWFPKCFPCSQKDKGILRHLLLTSYFLDAKKSRVSKSLTWSWPSVIINVVQVFDFVNNHQIWFFLGEILKSCLFQVCGNKNTKMRTKEPPIYHLKNSTNLWFSWNNCQRTLNPYTHVSGSWVSFDLCLN
jgi:hypothetical protein